MTRIYVLASSSHEFRYIVGNVNDIFRSEHTEFAMLTDTEQLNGYGDIVIIEGDSWSRYYTPRNKEITGELKYLQRAGRIRLWLCEQDFRR